MNLNPLKKEETVKEEPFMYTEDQLMARLRFFIGICLALTLTGIVFVVLYSIIFVTQPLNAMSPIDQKFFELIIPIATFLTGTLSGIMLASKDDKEAKMKALEAANRPTPVSPMPGSPTGPSFGATPTPRFTPSFGAPPPPPGMSQPMAPAQAMPPRPVTPPPPPGLTPPPEGFRPPPPVLPPNT